MVPRGSSLGLQKVEIIIPFQFFSALEGIGSLENPTNISLKTFLVILNEIIIRTNPYSIIVKKYVAPGHDILFLCYLEKKGSSKWGQWIRNLEYLTLFIHPQFLIMLILMTFSRLLTESWPISMLCNIRPLQLYCTAVYCNTFWGVFKMKLPLFLWGMATKIWQSNIKGRKGQYQLATDCTITKQFGIRAPF